MEKHFAISYLTALSSAIDLSTPGKSAPGQGSGKPHLGHLKWIAQRLRMGSWSLVSNLLSQEEAKKLEPYSLFGRFLG